MVVIVRIITVTNKSVSTIRSTSTIHHRKICRNVLLQQIVPLLITKICFHSIAEIGAETKEINQTRTGLKIKSTAFTGSVKHIYRHTTVSHQCSYCIYFVRSAIIGKCVRHIGIIISNAVVIDRQSTIIAVIAMDTATMLRILMIIDDLCHSSGYTTSKSVTTRTDGIFWAECIVVLSLVPSSSQ